MCAHTFIYIFIWSLLCTSHSWASPFFFFEQTSPLMRRQWGPRLRKRMMERCYAAGCKWGASCSARGRGMGASARSEFISFPSFWVSMWLPIIFHISTPVLFHLLGAGFIEKGGCPLRGSPEVNDRSPTFGGLWLGKNGGGSGRLRGGGFLWALEGSNVTFLHVLRPTSSKESLPHPICHHLPPGPSGVSGTQSSWSCWMGTGINLFNCPLSFRGRDPCQHATPLYSVGGIKIVYRCQDNSQCSFKINITNNVQCNVIINATNSFNATSRMQLLPLKWTTLPSI